MSTAIDSTTTALAPFKEMRDVLAPFPAERYHLLLPTTFVGVSPLFIPMPTVVSVNAADPREVYDTPGARDGTVCLHSTKLEQIANAGGLDFDPSLEMHVHDFQKEPYLCQMSVGGWYIDSIGQRRLVGDGVTHDLRDSSKRTALLGGPNAKPVIVARQFICEQARSRARARVIRKCMNLATSYTKAELNKPFVAIRFRLNEMDEDVKRALIARAVGATADLFGVRRALPSPPTTDATEDIIEGHTVDAEPEIPDEPAPAPAKKADVGAVIDGFRSAAKARPEKDAASDEMLTQLAYSLRDAWGLTDKDAIGVARRTVARAVFGASRLRDMTGAQVLVVVEATKELTGQAALAEIRDFLAQVDTEFAKAVGPNKSAA
jgi:hypothetical protein